MKRRTFLKVKPMTKVQLEAITPKRDSSVLNVDTQQIEHYDGTNWVPGWPDPERT